ncbi:MAG: iron ABC transporter permease [Gammaproteobacteria bacterium]|nr:iron ABC transporter permease [Gammaproteobacteria bacterium]
MGQLGIIAATIVVMAVVPLLFVIESSLELDSTQWARLWTNRLPELLGNTLGLATLVAIFSFVFGVSSAWLVARIDFTGRTLAQWLLLLPLTIPTYVFAHIYTSTTARDGFIGSTWTALFGSQAPDIYNVYGAAFILSLAGFSYIYLLVRAALSHSTRTLEESARLQGAGRLEVFWRINLPLLRPAIAAGLAVIVLHVLSDFGAVSMLRFQTFTLAIYTQMSGRMDYQGAAGLSLVLIILSLTFLIGERIFRTRQRYYASRQSLEVTLKPATTGQTVMIWAWLGSICFFSFLLPLGWMLSWTWQSLLNESLGAEFWGYAINSGVISFTAATIALVAAFPIAFFHSRKHTRTSTAFMHLSSVGFALPGPVVALGVLSFILAQLPFLYGTLAALVLAMVIRFLPLAIQSQEAALQQLTPSLEQAGRVFGATPLENLRLVILPVIRSGLASAWVLVFIDTLKELPATLLLRPTGFDTLPVRIWIEASEEMLELAAPAALVLVIGTLPAIWIMMKTERH